MGRNYKHTIRLKYQRWRILIVKFPSLLLLLPLLPSLTLSFFFFWEWRSRGPLLTFSSCGWGLVSKMSWNSRYSFLVKISSLVNWILCSDALCFSSPLCIIVDVANIRVNWTQDALNETSKHLFYITEDRRPSPLSAGGPRCAYNLCLNGSDTTMHLHQDIRKKNGKY